MQVVRNLARLSLRNVIRPQSNVLQRTFCSEGEFIPERSMNSVTLLGRAGKDPELRLTKDDRKWVTFSMATSQKFLKRDPDSDEEFYSSNTQWHNINIFNPALQKIVLDHVEKGCRVLVQGSLSYYPSVDDESKVTRMVATIIPNEVIVVSQPKKESEPLQVFEPIKPSRQKKKAPTTRITYNMSKMK